MRDYASLALRAALGLTFLFSTLDRFGILGPRARRAFLGERLRDLAPTSANSTGMRRIRSCRRSPGLIPRWKSD